MFKTAADRIAVIDIETIPCLPTIRRAYGLGPAVSDDDALAHAYKAHGATAENSEPFLKPMFHRVVSVCVLFRKSEMVQGGRQVSLKFHTLPGVSDGAVESLTEPEIVSRTLSFIGRHKAQVVGWNSFGFDQVALFNRAVILGVEAPAYCERPDKPWEGRDYFAKFSDANVDLMQCMAGESGSGRAKLGEFAAACGIPGKISEVSGGGVAQAFREGRLAEIHDYNQFDVASTYLIWLRIAWIGGHIGAAAYLAEQEQFKALLRSQADAGGTHWVKYLMQWAGEEYKPKAAPGAGLKQWACGSSLAMKIIEATQRFESSLLPARFPDQASRENAWRAEFKDKFGDISRKALTEDQALEWVAFLNDWAAINEHKAKAAPSKAAANA